MNLLGQRLQNLGWSVLGIFIAISLYPLWLSVASVRNKLADTEQRIVAVKKRIRYLEVEYASRSNMKQLQMWNDVRFGYTAPGAGQYLAGERELALLGENSDGRSEPVQLASAGALNGVKPAGIVGPVRLDQPPASALAPAAQAAPKIGTTDNEPNPVLEAAARRAAFAAKMEANLLSDGPAKNARKEIAK